MCGANAFEVTLTNNLGENTVLDCDDPLDVPAVVLRYLQTQDTSVTINGMLATQSFPVWRNWADTGALKNIKILLDEPAAQGGGFWVVPAYLTSLQLGKSNSETVTVAATITGAGQRVWTAAT